ncbi:MAG: ABC-2 transporter permease [Oscillospiraceae bacterium]|nr:ABC-2 transporter permease [Oscillospiraceae bacterium]
MRSKTSFFNRTVFFKTFTSYWPVWALYLVVWILILPVGIANSGYGPADSASLRFEVLNVASQVGVLGAITAGMIAGALTFIYSFNGRSSNFYASLPIRREGIYLTNYFSGLFWFIAANVIIVLLTLLVMAANRHVDFTALLEWFAIVSLLMVVFYSIAVFCAVVAGNVAGFLLMYAALNCGLFICEFLVKAVGAMMLKGLTVSDYFYTGILTPAYALWSDVVTTRSSDGMILTARYLGWPVLLIYTGAALLLAVIGLLIYRRRHMETASDLISVKALRPVFKYLFTFFCALALGFIIYEIVFAFSERASAVPLTVCMLIGAFIGYFGSAMLLNKSFRVFKKWPGYIVSALVIIAVMACVNYDVFGVEKYIPKTDKVESVTVDCSLDTGMVFTDKDNIKRAEEIHALLIGHDYEEGEFTGDYYRIIYTLKNGRKVERNYSYFVDSPSDRVFVFMDELLNSDEAVQGRLSTDIPVNEQTVYYVNVYGWVYDQDVYLNLAPADAMELYETCMLPDIEDGSLGTIDTKQSQEYEWLQISMELSVGYKADGDSMYYESDFDTLDLRVTPKAERTWKYLTDRISELGEPQEEYA